MEEKDRTQINEEEAMPVSLPDFEEETDEAEYSTHSVIGNVVAATEDLTEGEKYERGQLKGKAKIENFFYHYGVKLGIIAAVIAIIVSVTVMSLPKKYDQHVMIYANVNLGGEPGEKQTCEQIEKFCTDIDGDGKVRINLTTYNKNSEDMNIAILAIYALQTDFSDDYSSVLMVTDKPHLDFIRDCYGEDVFEKSEQFPDGVPLNRCKLFADVFGTEEEDMLYLQVVAVPEKKMKDKEIKARYEEAKAIVERVVEAHPEMKEND